MKNNAKTKIKNKLVSVICTLLMVITTMTVAAPMAASAANALVAAGFQVIKPLGVNTQIGPTLVKDTTAKCSSIFFDGGYGDSFKVNFWVKDLSNSKTLSNKKQFTVTSTTQKKWLRFKDGVSFTVKDTIVIYGEQWTLSNQGINYVTYGGQASGGSY